MMMYLSDEYFISIESSGIKNDNKFLLISRKDITV